MKRFAIVAVCLGISSCGGSEGTAAREPFCIELYSYGGFAGSAGGLTVTEDGWARYWTGRTVALRTMHDSLRMARDLVEKIRALADSGEAASFHYEKIGDLTTVLTIQRKGAFHRISFAGEQVPGAFPGPIRELIIEMRNLRKTTGGVK